MADMEPKLSLLCRLGIHKWSDWTTILREKTFTPKYQYRACYRCDRLERRNEGVDCA